MAVRLNVVVIGFVFKHMAVCLKTKTKTKTFVVKRRTAVRLYGLKQSVLHRAGLSIIYCFTRYNSDSERIIRSW